MTRERRAAETLLRRTGFEPPVPVDRLAAMFADLEYDVIPGACDGLIVGLTGQRADGRPTIIVASNAPLRRRRFTIGHELGHLLLPWHTGSTVACNTPLGWADELGAEPEANRFAAELLLPTAWVRAAIGRASDVPELLVNVAIADASAQATCIAIARLLPPGHLWAIVDESATVVASGRSPASSVQAPPEGGVPDFDRLARFANAVHVETVAGRTVMWWDFTKTSVDLPSVKEPRLLLSELLEKYVHEPSRRGEVAMRIAGIGGSAKSMANDPSDADEIHGRLRRAFTKRRDYLPPGLLDDPKFKLWLDARAHQLASEAK